MWNQENLIKQISGLYKKLYIFLYGHKYSHWKHLPKPSEKLSLWMGSVPYSRTRFKENNLSVYTLSVGLYIRLIDYLSNSNKSSSGFKLGKSFACALLIFRYRPIGTLSVMLLTYHIINILRSLCLRLAAPSSYSPRTRPAYTPASDYNYECDCEHISGKCK